MGIPLSIKYFKYVAAGGDLDAAPERSLTADAVVAKYSEKLVENKTSKSPNPTARHAIGFIPEYRGILEDWTQNDLVAVFGGVNAANVWTKTQVVRQLGLFDIRLAYYRASDGLLVIEDATNMNFIPELELSYEQEKKTYMPFSLMPTATTEVTRDDSAA